MATRKIITVDEDLCNGCGNCITGCAEGALALVDGKAKLVKEMFCDGFGDCIGTCPTGALKIEEREADAYDERATFEHVARTRGNDGVKQFQHAARQHVPGTPHTHPAPAQRPAQHPGHAGGCPGMRARFTAAPTSDAPTPTASGASGHAIASELRQWPIQLHLVQPGAPCFHNRELVVLSTCSPVASADVHWRFIRGRGVVVACPKLDRTDPYAEKLGAILQDATIPKVIVVRMTVPCCGGLTMLTRQAVELSGRDDLVVEEVTVDLDGNVVGVQQIG